MTTYICIDPGPEYSGMVVYDGERVVEVHPQAENWELLETVRGSDADDLVCEMVASYGMPVGKDVFDTCVWIGRYIEAFRGATHRVYRKDVKMALCGVTKAKDANIRQALIDRFGPGKGKAIGNKAAPGPLYGVAKHAWAALAVGVTHCDTRGI